MGISPCAIFARAPWLWMDVATSVLLFSVVTGGAQAAKFPAPPPGMKKTLQQHWMGAGVSL